MFTSTIFLYFSIYSSITWFFFPESLPNVSVTFFFFASYLTYLSLSSPFAVYFLSTFFLLFLFLFFFFFVFFFFLFLGFLGFFFIPNDFLFYVTSHSPAMSPPPSPLHFLPPPLPPPLLPAFLHLAQVHQGKVFPPNVQPDLSVRHCRSHNTNQK